MRISGGTCKGVRLRAPAGVRPASERVRQAVFSSLGDAVTGARVLDLFCGSGAYGLEALSRGAESAVFVDAGQPSIRAVRDNAAATGLDERATLRRRDAIVYAAAPPASDAPFDLVIADPPYDLADAATRLLDVVQACVAPGASIVLELRWTPDDPPHGGDGTVLEADRRYGDTRVLTYRSGKGATSP